MPFDFGTGGCAGAPDEALEMGLDYDAPLGTSKTVDGRRFSMGTSGEWVEILQA